MFGRDDYSTPERRASTAFPVSVLLLAICAIFAYLAIGGALLEEGVNTAVYIPQTADTSGSR
ncbi:hypothetical protein PYH37_005158 [Sinorhizobium numidicum]|uniref:Uncharacterized protein n=1 Tax=Sinorhizobium numidicum TaxID=680248 RepID=A0ABY8CXV2_9HYPH|nr:hypothetical protein [Sinorhizobium numidicum]WEX76815.1 hypothetical protein PYH37_005158 [Sinorhizobium numidicum]WEX83476.1 hypothetical protein PYH38_002251 [Sinorhizobium numidicum]